MMQVFQVLLNSLSDASNGGCNVSDNCGNIQDNNARQHRRNISAPRYFHAGRFHSTATYNQALVDLGLLDLPSQLC